MPEIGDSIPRKATDPLVEFNDRNCRTANGRLKRGYRSKKEARAQARVLAKKAGDPGGEKAMKVYRCQTCKMYHVGHARGTGKSSF